jgi:adenylate cyclase
MNRIRVFQRLSFRVAIVALLVVLAGMGSVIAYLQRAGVRTLHEVKGEELKIDAALAARTVQNLMMAENPGFAAQLFSDIAGDPLLSRIALYRIDGSPAFSDASTVKEVNGIIGRERFTPVDETPQKGDLSDPAFRYAVNRVNEVTTRIDGATGSLLIYHLPLVNQPRCTGCHGTDHVVRGVIRVTATLEGERRAIGHSLLVSITLCGITVCLLVAALILYVNRAILRPLRGIGIAVSRAASGAPGAGITATAADEIGLLALHCSRLITRGERRETERTEEGSAAGEENAKPRGGDEWLTIEAAILVVSLRGIAMGSEAVGPERTLESIGTSLEIQTGVIRDHEGVIAAIAGYGMTAYFPGDDGAIRALRAAEALRSGHSGQGEGTPHVGMGVHTGTITVGSPGGGDAPGAVIGEAVDLCARLCASAGRNTIVLSEECNEIVQGMVVTSPQAPLTFRGGRVRMNIYTLRKVL